ncbi:30S ribosomal protein S6 [bacterium]|nr:30S ribosomal protein S6 [bacterium]
MKTYELLTFLKPNLDQDEVDALSEKLVSSIEGLKGKSLETEKAGRKRLPYEVKGYTDGYMMTTLFELPEDQVAELKRLISLNDNIIRTMFVEAKKVRVVK